MLNSNQKIKIISLKYKILIFLWIIVILILSSISGDSLEKVPKINIPHFDKIVHFGMYSILQYLFILKFSKTTCKISASKFLFITSIFSVSYSISMEFAQAYLFEKRSGDVFDVLANTIGVVVVIVFYKLNILKKLRLI